jgi:holo-[acyl-carrier protein] synthase
MNIAGLSMCGAGDPGRSCGKALWPSLFPPSGFPALSERMIIGLGSDLCNIERIQNSLDRFGDRFKARVFTDIENDKAARRPFTQAGTYAKRFAAKEAFSKAVGTGFKRGVFMKDIGVVNAPSGAPTLALTGGAKARLDAMIPSGYEAHIHLTLTDDHPWAQAFVIIEALPAPQSKV